MELVFIVGEGISTTLLWPTCSNKNLSCKTDYALTIYLQAFNTSDREAWLAPWKLLSVMILCENWDLIDLKITLLFQKIACNQL